MLNVQQLAEKAVRFARELYGEDQVFNPRIDEVEREGDTWSITLSWLQARPGMPEVAFTLPVPSGRIYKQFAVNGETGEVKSMKIRQVE